MTTTPKTFSLSPYRSRATPGETMRLVSLDFQIYTDDLNEHLDPALAALPSPNLDYGALIAYCLRRFGFPNRGSDSYKDIAAWWLTTPHPDLILCICPSVLPEAYFSIRWLTSSELGTAARNWERQDVDAWVDRKLDWVEAQGLPAWMPEFLESFQSQQWPGATWRDAYRAYICMFAPREGRTVDPEGGRGQTESQAKLSAFAAMVEGYRAIEPRPSFRKRSLALSQWPSGDPLKPLAEAAIEALRDLATGVRVRDSAINAYGVLLDDTDESIVEEPESAGLGVGDMINRAPQESVEIYQLASRLGEGDLQVGLARLLEIASQAEGGTSDERE